MRTLLRRYELVILAGILAAGMVLNFSQTYTDIRSIPAGTVFPLVHGYAEDYYYYLHIMRQGFDGHSAATSKLTPEVFEPQFVVPFFLILGHIARIVHQPLPVAYTVARLTGAVISIILCTVFLFFLFPKSRQTRIMGLLLIIFSGYFWVWKGGAPAVSPLVHAWVELDPMVRFSYIPHHLWSKVFMLLMFLFLITRTVGKQQTLLLVVFAGISTLCMGFSSPVAIASVAPTLLLWGFFELAVSGKKTIRTPWFAVWMSAVGTIMYVALYHRIVQTRVFPWTSYLGWEEMKYTISFVSYCASFGPLIFLFPFGVLPLWNMGRVGRLCIAWALSGFIGVYVLTRVVPLNNIRYLGGYQFIPISIGALLGLQRLAQRAGTYTSTIVWGIVGLIIAYSAVCYAASYEEHRAYLRNDLLYPAVYIPRDTFDSIRFLDKTMTESDVVLTSRIYSQLIPAFTSGRSIAGHHLMTLNDAEKTKEIENFFAYTNSSEMIHMIDKYRISYIMIEQIHAIPPFVLAQLQGTMVFENPSMVVYHIR